MIARIKLPPGGFVLIGDGRKALVLVNRGDERCPDLRLAEILRAPSNPATHEQGTDQPGRAIVGSSRRSCLEQTDRHQIAKDRFSDEVAADIAKGHRKHPFPALVLVAPPHTLAELRHALTDDVRRVVRAEIDKDLTKLPLDEIEKRIIGR